MIVPFYDCFLLWLFPALLIPLYDCSLLCSFPSMIVPCYAYSLLWKSLLCLFPFMIVSCFAHSLQWLFPALLISFDDCFLLYSLSSMNFYSFSFVLSSLVSFTYWSSIFKICYTLTVYGILMISAFQCWHTLKWKPHLCIPWKGIARPRSQFSHSYAFEQFKYSQDRSTYFPAAE
jgi:hypothetical protein